MNQPPLSRTVKTLICEACGRRFLPKHHPSKRTQKTCGWACAGRLGGLKRAEKAREVVAMAKARTEFGA